MSKLITLARENAILGDYDSALAGFKNIFRSVNEYAKKYEGNSNKLGRQKGGVGASADYYL